MRELIPEKLDGIRHIDDRGVLKAWHLPENFDVKRFYLVSNWTQGFIRAWHGHFHEEKMIFVIKGAGLIACVPIDDVNNPNKNVKPTRFILDASSSAGIRIPSGYANGLMSLTDNCEFLVLSNRTVEESKSDDFRFPFDYWQAWDIEQR